MALLLTSLMIRRSNIKKAKEPLRGFLDQKAIVQKPECDIRKIVIVFQFMVYVNFLFTHSVPGLSLAHHQRHQTARSGLMISPRSFNSTLTCRKPASHILVTSSASSSSHSLLAVTAFFLAFKQNEIVETSIATPTMTIAINPKMTQGLILPVVS